MRLEVTIAEVLILTSVWFLVKMHNGPICGEPSGLFKILNAFGDNTNAIDNVLLPLNRSVLAYGIFCVTMDKRARILLPMTLQSSGLVFLVSDQGSCNISPRAGRVKSMHHSTAPKIS